MRIKKWEIILNKYFLVLVSLSFAAAQAFDYTPKNIDVNPFGTKTEQVKNNEHASKPEMREIKNLTEYFKYLPAEVHRHWTPYKAETSYEVAVQFRVNRDGSIADVKILNSTNPSANESVLNALKNGAPYQPLPASYPNQNGVMAQIVLEYRK